MNFNEQLMEEEKTRRTGESTIAFKATVKAIVVFVLAIATQLFLAYIPEMSGVKNKAIFIAELKTRSLGEEVKTNEIKNRKIHNMSDEEIVKSLKQAREDERKMQAFFAPEPKKLETPRELEVGIENTISEILSTTDEEFEAILKTSTIGDLKTYLKTVEKLSKSLKGRT